MHHLSIHYLAMIVCILPEAACSIVRENSNLAAAESADLSDAADDLRCLGLPVGLALLGGELPVDDILIVRLRIICTRGRGPADAPPLTGIG